MSNDNEQRSKQVRRAKIVYSVIGGALVLVIAASFVIKSIRKDQNNAEFMATIERQEKYRAEKEAKEERVAFIHDSLMKSNPVYRDSVDTEFEQKNNAQIRSQIDSAQKHLYVVVEHSKEGGRFNTVDVVLVNSSLVTFHDIDVEYTTVSASKSTTKPEDRTESGTLHFNTIEPGKRYYENKSVSAYRFFEPPYLLSGKVLKSTLDIASRKRARSENSRAYR